MLVTSKKTIFGRSNQGNIKKAAVKFLLNTISTINIISDNNRIYFQREGKAKATI